MVEVKKKKIVQVQLNETGHIVGEHHPKASLTDVQVDLMRDLREDHGLKYSLIAWIFGVSEHYAKDICLYRRRNATSMRSKSRVVEE